MRMFHLCTICIRKCHYVLRYWNISARTSSEMEPAILTTCRWIFLLGRTMFLARATASTSTYGEESRSVCGGGVIAPGGLRWRKWGRSMCLAGLLGGVCGGGRARAAHHFTKAKPT